MTAFFFLFIVYIMFTSEKTYMTTDLIHNWSHLAIGVYEKKNMDKKYFSTLSSQFIRLNGHQLLKVTT